jgi:hypothetical protein
MGELSEERQRALAWLQGIAESDPAGEVDIVPARVLVIWLEEIDALRSKLAEVEAERDEQRAKFLAEAKRYDRAEAAEAKLAEAEESERRSIDHAGRQQERAIAAEARVEAAEDKLAEAREAVRHMEAAWVSAVKRADAAEAKLAEVEKACLEEIGHRDRFEEAIANAHVALGGDGEWSMRMPEPPPPDSGDLARDVPVLAAEVAARVEALEGAWLTVCREGNVPQYEEVTEAHPNSILHGVRQLAAIASNERVLHGETRARAERTEAKVAELRKKLALAGVEGSPPPGGQGTIPALLQRAQSAERKLATEEERAESLNRALGAAEAKLAEAERERDAWRDVIAVLCGDGGHYHQEHGTEATKQHALDRFYALRKRVEALEGALLWIYARTENLPIGFALSFDERIRKAWPTINEKAGPTINEDRTALEGEQCSPASRP